MSRPTLRHTIHLRHSLDRRTLVNLLALHATKLESEDEWKMPTSREELEELLRSHEHLEQRNLERQRERERNLELAREEIERIEPHIPLHHPDGARFVAGLRSDILHGLCLPKSIRCNHCHTRLWSDRPDVRCLMSHPPKEHIACPGCGWSGYL